MIKHECKIVGINPVWITGLLTGVFLAVCSGGGDNIHWGYVGFEIIFPFYTAIIVGKWCRVRTDLMFETIAAQAESLFTWIVRRYILLLAGILVFSIAGIEGVSALKPGMDVMDLLLTYMTTAFFLSSLCVAVSICTSTPHMAVMVTGIVWLFSLMAVSMIRYKTVSYFYLFIRYAGGDDPIWRVNKTILVVLGLCLWGISYTACRIRIFAASDPGKD
ncbi:hypothetical protein [Diplocloster modestus]|uniref:ABC-2 family transporter protein n=1 Tax=Diplocloster modestus TaxID=2850322 RepID=A0ABS6KDK2_9FIRM|nr:hypothetical protein [Diplocloster modestus]MBU9728601.1 hypothetical protein [Diplocloster modestus]